MNQQTNLPTEQVPKVSVTPLEITSLGSPETVAASIDEIFVESAPQPEPKPETSLVQTGEVNPDSQQIETAVAEASTSSPIVEVSADNLLINPLEPVIEEESPPLRDPATVATLHRDIQKMIEERQYSGAEQEVIHERIQNTDKISLS